MPATAQEEIQIGLDAYDSLSNKASAFRTIYVAAIPSITLEISHRRLDGRRHP